MNTPNHSSSHCSPRASTRSRVRLAAIAILGSIGLAIPLGADSASIAGEDQQARTNEIEGVIRRLLEREPEIVSQALARAEQKARRADAERATALFRETLPAILAESSIHAIGEQGQPLLVSIYDYNCGFCKRFDTQSLPALLKANPRARVLFVNSPILSEGSMALAMIAQAARRQGKFIEVHEWLMRRDPIASSQEAMSLIPELAKAVSLDAERLRKDAASAEVRQEVQRQFDLARKAGLTGTPYLWVNGEAVRGAMPPDALVQQMTTPARR